MLPSKTLHVWIGCLMAIMGVAASQQAHAFCDPPNLLIVLDRSGSMLNGNKWSDAKQAITTVTNTQQGKVRFGLETFSDNANIDAPLPSTNAAITTALNKLAPLGQTFMVKAMTTARSHIISVLTKDTKPGRPTSILFITDGTPSDRCPTSEVSGLRSVTVNNLKYDVKTYVIGFGSLVNRNCLNDMATRGGTALGGSIQYYVANNASDLVSAINKIVSSALKKQPEVCDNKDNDCDGQTDEGLTRACSNNKCKGTETCKAGKYTGCTARPTTTEVCDNVDNDCDGKIDENLSRACTVKCGASNRSGTETCKAGQWINCTARPTSEKCDNIDNDCDGQIDEGVTRTCYNNKCRGTETCKAGKFTGCTAAPTKTEVCNNSDDDCDGNVDEGLTRACSIQCGSSTRSGTETCKAGKWVNCSAKASNEVCDNIDNDCDGQIDEGITRNCRDSKTRCLGKQTCKAGKFEACVAPAPQTETCNNKDDDCDGRIDEGVTRACSYMCAGKSRAGTETCNRGRWVNCSARPTSEKCDNIDNDCDGQIDENLTQNCTDSTTKCRGKRTCQAGKFSACVAPAPTQEVCDKVDNDCDGSVDENVTRGCSIKCGNSTLSGTEKCSNGSWYGCTAKATKEVCDNKDNDCDGTIDDNLSRACGKCGTQVCAAGKWGTCVEAKSAPETCNNKDDDCDGQVDENLTQSCKYKTCTGSQTCSRGRWSSCQPPAEICDGKDNDCDGKIDENFGDKGRICGSGLGICYRTGKFTCKPDGSGLECNVPPGKPEKEVCDAKDNDCDGKSDEDLKRPCKAKCLDGTQECKEGSWATCVANPDSKPPPEQCNNNIDDNCDGTIDEGCGCPPGTTRPCGNTEGECTAGIQKCEVKGNSGAGVWSTQCEGGKGPQQEVCNGKDDDCDGEIDEEVTRPCETKCGKGTQACIQGDWSTCSGGHPRPELCNGKDDDCDGQIDNGAVGSCGASTGCYEGGCRPKCRGGECPGGQQCIEDVCVSKGCQGVTCPSGYQCEEGKCVDLCNTTTCPSGLLCQRGSCLPKNCYAYGCEAGKTCVEGTCVSDPCDGKNCAEGSFCRDGKCIAACACQDGEYCVNDQCVSDPCDGVTCDAGTFCRDGKCEKVCQETCHSGQFCKEGKCVHDPCLNISCPSGTVCFEGQCTTRVPPRKPVQGGEGIEPDGTIDTDGGTTTDEPTGTPTDDGTPTPKPDKSTDPPVTGDKGGSGDGDIVGCNCQVGNNSTTGLLWFGLLFFFLLLQRRKRA